MEGAESDWQEYTRIFIGIFALVPPPIIVPLFLGMAVHLSKPEKNQAAFFGVAGFFVVMTIFVFAGRSVLDLFGISLPAFRMAGGFLLLLIALDLLRARASGYGEGNPHDGQSAMSLAAVPLTIPILAGPGAISTVILFATDNDGDPLNHKLAMVGVIFVVAAISYVVLRMAVLTERLFTADVTLVFSKVMGLLIAAIAFEFIMGGIAGFFPSL